MEFSQFGRCLDVTEQNVSKGYLIAWPCKQAPDPTSISWYQKWALPAVGSPGRITTRPSTGTYCLQSPGSTASGQYVTVALCPSGSTTPTNMTWTVYGDTGSYDTGYRIKDGYGYCLSPTDPTATPPDFYTGGGQNISKIVVATCNGSTLQKWSAPEHPPGHPLKDIGER